MAVSSDPEVFPATKDFFHRLGPDVDPFVLHLYAALAEKERVLIGQRTKAVFAAVKAKALNARGVRIARDREWDATSVARVLART